MLSKKCRDCGSVDEGAFCPSSRYLCRRCYNAYRSGWRATRRERERELDRARWARNPERRKRKTAAALRWFAKHPEKVAENRRRMAAWKVEYLRAHPEVRRKADRRYWSKPENKVRRAHLTSLRRAREMSAVGAFTLGEWRSKLAEYGDRCAYCGVAGSLTRDHVIPLSRGGTNYIDNIVPACKSCNSRKHNRTATEFISVRKVA